MGEWLDFGPYNDEDDEYEDDESAVDFEPQASSSEGDVYICTSCSHEYRAGKEEVLHRTVVDITQRYPDLDFRRFSIVKMTVRAHGKYVAIEEACRDCWNREAWHRIQRAYGYQSRP